MVIDASALAALLTNHPDAGALRRAIVDAERVVLAPETYVRFFFDLQKEKNAAFAKAGAKLLELAQGEIVEVDAEIAEIAKNAICSQAGLSLDAAFAFALAQARGLPLLHRNEALGGLAISCA
ncbi:MAG TPA: hypothetical protein DCZ49_06450 [Hyphomonadaceae bacterium]|nr:hypothetical protein [Hyphomonadaceae bacterium]